MFGLLSKNSEQTDKYDTNKYHDEVIEEYEGEFDVGYYHGKGTLNFPKGKVTDSPEVYEGTFEMGKFMG